MKYVIVGNGIAGVSAVEAIRRYDPQGEITLIADETLPPYCRPMISMLLEGSINADKLPVRGNDFYEKNHVTPVLGARVTSMDVDGRTVATADGSTYSYDRLLIASGADPRPIEAQGADLENIFYMRTAAQVRQMLKALPQVGHALVLGGGLVGFKAAYGLLRQHIGVTMLITSGYPLAMQVDDTAGRMIQDVLTSRGLDVRTGVSVAAFEGGPGVTGARLSDGSRISCGMVIVGKGVTPASAFIDADKIDMETGILVNARMETSRPGVYAAGDIAECLDIARDRYQVNAIWPEAVSQGQTAGMNMAGMDVHYGGSLSRNVIRIFDTDVMTAGMVSPAEVDDTCQTLVSNDRKNNAYQKLVFKEDRLVGFVLVNRIEQGGILTALIRSRRPIDLKNGLQKEALISPRFTIATLVRAQALSP